MAPVDITGRGDPLVLIHGLATTRSIWRHTIAQLAATRQVVTLDVPGFGTSRPVARGFDLETVARRVDEDLTDAGVARPFHLVGHSMGAAVALTLAAREPAAVRSLVLVSPAGLRPIPRTVAAALGLAAELYVPVRRRASPLAAWSWGRRLLMAGGVANGAALEPAVVRTLVCASLGAQRTGPALSAVASADLRGVLAELPLAVGAMWGRDDRVIPAGGARTLLQLRPDARCEIVEGAGHISMVEQPEAFVEALERLLVAMS